MKKIFFLFVNVLFEYIRKVKIKKKKILKILEKKIKI